MYGASSKKILFKLLGLFIFVHILLRCMYMYHTCTWCFWKSEKIIRAPGNIIKDGFEPLYGYYELNPGLFQKHPLLLDAKQSIHPRKTFLHKCAHVCMYTCMCVCVCIYEYIK